MADKRPLRITKNAYSWEVPKGFIFVTIAFRMTTWFFRRLKPILYHPIGLVGLTLWLGSYAINPWLTAALFWGLLTYQRLWPYSYHRNVTPRVVSFFVGFKYRYRPRRKLTANGLLDIKDPIPTISCVTKMGCTTRVRIRMSDGDEIDYWRERAARLAQTYNAGDCKVNPYRRANFMSFKADEFLLKPPFIRYHFEEQIPKYRWLELEFMTRDPFTKTIGPEYIEFYRDLYENLPELGNPVGPYRSGQPHRFLVRTHKLVVAPSQRGKSSAERCMVYADHLAVQAGLVENWGCDLKRGVEIKFMEGQFARTEFGLDGPEMVARFFEEAMQVMNNRLDKIRELGEGVRHIPVKGDPALRIYIDEFLAFEDTEYNEHRARIYRAIAAIQRRGAAAGVSIIAFSQDPKKDKFPLRDGFLEVEVGGGLSQTQVGMVMPGGWDDGARTDLIDLPGVFYVRNETLLAPEQFRYAFITNGTIKGLKKCPESVLWPLSKEDQPDIGEVVLIA